MALNVYLTEATEQVENLDKVVKEIKSKMNACKLAKFKSTDACTEFYVLFFANSTPENTSELSFNDWFNVYSQLFSQPQFKANLIFYISLFHPVRYDGIFKPLLISITREAEHTKDQLYYYSDVKAKLTQLRADFSGVCQSAMQQTVSQEPVQFCKAIDGALSDMITAVNRAQEAKLLERDNGDGIRKVIRPYPMSESSEEYDENDEEMQQYIQEAHEFVTFLESFSLENIMNEDIADKLSDLKDDLQYGAMVAEDKIGSGARKIGNAISTFDRKLSSWIDRFKRYRKEKQISAMLGETHHVMREIIRITGTLAATAALPVGGAKLFRALIGVVIYMCSWWVTSKTTKNDLRKFIESVKDEMEILDKKIEQAERSGDDKGVIQLMRMRQKMKHELDRLLRKAYPVTHNVRPANS